MLKFFRKPTHTDHAATSLAEHRIELLAALEKLEYYEGYVAAKRKTIKRLEATYEDSNKTTEKPVYEQSTIMEKVPFGYRLSGSAASDFGNTEIPNDSK